MKQNSLDQLIAISQYYGNNLKYVIAGGGNTSFKDDDHIWVKASGTSLATIKEDGFVCLSRSALKQVKDKKYSNNSTEREEQVKQDLYNAIVASKHLRPSVETSMHEIIDFSYIVHTHPTFVNALMCSKNAERLTKEIFGNDVVYVEYTDPGYILFKKVLCKINDFKAAKGFTPSVIFLQNHGVFVGADTTDKIKNIYEGIEQKLKAFIGKQDINTSYIPKVSPTLKLIDQFFSKKSLMAKGYYGELIQYFIKNNAAFQLISKPFTPDIIVYCKSNYLFLEKGSNEAEIVKSIELFQSTHKYFPKVIIVENDCLVVVEDSEKNITTVLQVFIDMMKISWYSNSFGGPNFMTSEQIEFIDNWEVENYRRKISKEAN
jgi:rhamnose utilization protein RhaD (predicted bifunctional aldolase and dehydrogenase)